MKKLFSVLMLGAFAAMVACGPSAEEKAAAEKARQDSINAAMAKASEDSMAAVQVKVDAARQDSMANAMKADSMAKAEAAAKKPAKPASKPKTIEQRTKEEAKKVTSGRNK